MLTSLQVKKLKKVNNPTIRKRYGIYFQLPPEMRNLFFNENTANQVREIGLKNNLDREQLVQASYVTGLILLGETNIVNFVKSLQKECGLAEEPARQLARDINQTIFLPVKENLKKIHRVPSWPREEGTVKEPSPSPVVKLKDSPPERAESQPARGDTYREPIETSDQAKADGPRLEGNVVDLKNGH